MLAGAHIVMDGYEGDHDLVIMPNLDGFDMILGRSFLQASRAVVHHETATILCAISKLCLYAACISHTNNQHQLSMATVV